MAKFKVANNTTSYDTGSKPHKHDDNRGIWSSNWDFFWACLTHSFGLRIFSIVPLFMLRHGVVFFIIPFTVGIFLFIVPIYFIQSFLGQFSSSGYISAFRIAPLFKGIGYVILVLNLTSTMYYGSLASLPLIYIFNSLNPYLSWMHCDNSWNTDKCREIFGVPTKLTDFLFNDTVTTYNMTYDDYDDEYWSVTWPSLEFLKVSIDSLDKGEWSFAWRLFLCSGIVYVLLAFVITRGVQMFGKIMRYIGITLVALLVILTIRCVFSHDSENGFKDFFVARNISYIYKIEFWLIIPYIAACAFGSGWSSTLTLASYNNFKCDIGKISVMIAFSHMLIVIISALIVFIIEECLKKQYLFNLIFYGDQPIIYVYAIIPLFFNQISWPNLWLSLFFLLLFLAEFSSLAIQIFSILTALFDEYEHLRTNKINITIGLISSFALLSIFFSTNHGATIAINLYDATSLSQMLVCFIELMIVVWVYGRIRFQRDVQFMLGHMYPSWRFFLIRFITPFYIFLALVVSVLLTYFSKIGYVGYGLAVIYITLGFFMKLLPIICLPTYIIIKITTASGSILNRFKKLCRPNDWYPANKIDRERYEVTLGNASDIARQLIVEDFDEP